jgi:redox-sensitive bicupin YhaK (pirin superfamily)
MGVTVPVQNIVTDPEYHDVSVLADTTFTHGIERGHTAFAYVIEGRACFDQRRNPYGFEQVGQNYFDLHRECRFGPESLVLYGDGDLHQMPYL